MNLTGCANFPPVDSNLISHKIDPFRDGGLYDISMWTKTSSEISVRHETFDCLWNIAGFGSSSIEAGWRRRNAEDGGGVDRLVGDSCLTAFCFRHYGLQKISRLQGFQGNPSSFSSSSSNSNFRGHNHSNWCSGGSPHALLFNFSILPFSFRPFITLFGRWKFGWMFLLLIAKTGSQFVYTSLCLELNPMTFKVLGLG